MTPHPTSAAGHLEDYMAALRDYTLSRKELAIVVRRIKAATWCSEEKRAALLAEVGRVAR